MRVVLASCKVLPEPDPDEALLVEALRSAGIDAKVHGWDDDATPFASADLVVLRSTWNYYERVDAFLAWLDRTSQATRLFNPVDVVRTNVEKTYLRDLAARGVAIVPTEFVGVGERCDVARLMEERGFSKVVVKPVVSAGSFRTESFTADRSRDAQAFLDDLVRDRAAMVQKWMPAVETYGERSLVWIDGDFTHAIRKSPRFAGGVEQVSGAMPIDDRERAFAEDVLAPFAASLLYARVDVIRDEDDVLRVMEVELVEPSLFLQQAPHALDRFVRAIARRAG